MDRRYSQARFYNGAPASSGSSQRSEALVRQHLQRARNQGRQAETFGGSTGGSSSIGGVAAVIQRSRGDAVKEARQVFKDQGGGRLGARASLAAIRGYGSGAATINKPSSIATPLS
jgi:hypothetical protein